MPKKPMKEKELSAALFTVPVTMMAVSFTIIMQDHPLLTFVVFIVSVILVICFSYTLWLGKFPRKKDLVNIIRTYLPLSPVFLRRFCCYVFGVFVSVILAFCFLNLQIQLPGFFAQNTVVLLLFLLLNFPCFLVLNSWQKHKKQQVFAHNWLFFIGGFFSGLSTFLIVLVIIALV